MKRNTRAERDNLEARFAILMYRIYGHTLTADQVNTVKTLGFLDLQESVNVLEQEAARQNV